MRCLNCGKFRSNPIDENLRRLERIFASDPTDENFYNYQTALIRAGKINYRHYCNNCILMHSEKSLDYYFCPGSFGGSLIIRYGEEDPQYSSYPVDILLSVGSRSLSVPFKKALQLAIDQGYVPPAS